MARSTKDFFRQLIPKRISNVVNDLFAGIPFSERAEAEEVVTVPAHRKGVVRIDHVNGRLRLVGSDRKDILLRVQKSVRAESQEAAEAVLKEISIATHKQHDALEIQVVAPKRWNRHVCTNLDVEVPRKSSVQIYSSNGSMCIRELVGKVHARSSNGSININDVKGDIDAETSNGKILLCRFPWPSICSLE